jgi:protease-4
MVDGALYADQMEDLFTSEYGIEEPEFVTLGQYTSALTPDVDNLSAPKVAIVYANGQVLDGEGSDDNIYGYTLSKTIRKVAEDDDVKAVVVRVNSPGGSVLAADIIWREMKLLQEKKPVVISMGEYAASGGYYISACADAIVSDKLTLTGSIGVFGMLIEGKNLLNDKLGITTDVVKTNSSADFGENILGLGVRKITDAERKALLRSVDKVYETFTSRVSNGRNLPMERVLDIAQGRVWSGTRAVELGLVDGNGGLREAIAVAADRAGIIDNFRVSEVLEELTPFAEFIQSLNSGTIKSPTLDREVMEAAEYYKTLKRELSREGVQMFCPYSVGIN